VADAAVRACSDDIELFVLEAAEKHLVEDYQVSSQLDNERNQFRDLAKSYVVQARAGDCQHLQKNDV
jgi:hypothetical protein